MNKLNQHVILSYKALPCKRPHFTFWPWAFFGFELIWETMYFLYLGTFKNILSRPRIHSIFTIKSQDLIPSIFLRMEFLFRSFGHNFLYYQKLYISHQFPFQLFKEWEKSNCFYLNYFWKHSRCNKLQFIMWK